MKALTLVLLALALGAGLFFFVLDSDGGRGRQERRADPSAPARPREPAGRQELEPAAEPQRATRAEPGPRRQSVETGAAREVRLVLEGTVIAEGAPIPGASLALLRHDVLLAEAQSDARGRFRFESAPLSSGGTLRVVARGFVPTERNLAAKPTGGTVMLGNLRLLRGQRLSGRVVDGRNAGIADAEVRAEPLQAGGDLLVARGRSGPDGRFELGDAPPGGLLVSARARGFGEQSVQHVTAGQPITIQLQPGLDLRIVLRTSRGQPVVGAEVTIQATNDARSVKRVAESDADGRVLFEGLGSPTWTARVTHPEYRPSGRSVQANGAEEAIECFPWPAIEGQVRAPGGAAPPAGTRVQALPAAAPSERVAVLEGGQEVRPDGSFRLAGLRAGEWRVRVAAPGFAPATSGPVKLGIEGDGYAGTIELQSGSQLVLALVLGTGPVVGAEVELLPTAPTPAQLWASAGARGQGAGRRAVSGPDGRITLPNLAPGPVWLAIYAEGCPPTSSGPHVVATEPGQPIAIELTRGGRVSGRVIRKAGAPIAGAQVRLVERGGKLGFPLTLAGEQDGSYTSAWLPAGMYAIEAFAPQEPTLRSGIVELDVKAGEQHRLDLEL